MATITPLKHTPHTRIENTIIANMSEMGVYCYAVYCAIKMHLNQATGNCFPSYATIARITGIHRSTVIECVKKLRVLKLGFFAYPPIRYISALYTGVAHEARGTLR